MNHFETGFVRERCRFRRHECASASQQYGRCSKGEASPRSTNCPGHHDHRIGLEGPAYAGTLTSASFSAAAAYRSTVAQNTTYDWGFTTATTATLSKVTMTVPTGTGGSSRYLALNGSTGNYASTPDATANSITGDIDIRVKASPNSWASGSGQRMVSKWGSGGVDRSYIFQLGGDGKLNFWHSTNGSSNQTTSTSTAAVPFTNGQAGWIRTTFSPNNGSSGNTATFYTSTDGSTWSQLGSAVTAGGTTPLYDGASVLEIGSSDVGGWEPVTGKVYYAEVRNGINGTVANKFDPMDATPTQATAGSWTSTSPQNETWTINRSGSGLRADIAFDLSASNIGGLPLGGAANYRFIDAVAGYYFGATSVPSGTPCTVSLQGFTNTATAGSYSSAITTFNTTPTSVDSVTTATLAFTDDSSSQTVAATVDPSMQFTVAGRSSVCNGQSATNFQTGSTATAASLGHLSSSTVGGGAQDLTVNTNAANGFTVYLRTAGTTPHSLRDSAAHSIADVSGTRASPGSAPSAGTAGFGYTSDDTSTAFTSNTWAKLTNINDSVIIGSAGTTSKTNCVGYEVAIASTTPAGSYSSIVVYTAVPSF